MGASGVAYGLHLSGVPWGAHSPVGDPDPRWPAVAVRRAAPREAGAGPPVGDDGAGRGLPAGRRAVRDRRRGTATFTGPPVSDDELLHPYLGPVATLVGRWHGRETFHAGAF